MQQRFLDDRSKLSAAKRGAVYLSYGLLRDSVTLLTDMFAYFDTVGARDSSMFMGHEPLLLEPDTEPRVGDDGESGGG